MFLYPVHQVNHIPWFNKKKCTEAALVKVEVNTGFQLLNSPSCWIQWDNGEYLEAEIPD